MADSPALPTAECGSEYEWLRLRDSDGQGQWKIIPKNFVEAAHAKYKGRAAWTGLKQQEECTREGPLLVTVDRSEPEEGCSAVLSG